MASVLNLTVSNCSEIGWPSETLERLIYPIDDKRFYDNDKTNDCGRPNMCKISKKSDGRTLSIFPLRALAYYL